jgi:hypothetical protein
MITDVKTNRTFLRASSVQSWLNRVGPALGLLLVIGIFTLLMDTPRGFSRQTICASSFRRPSSSRSERSV